MHVITQMPAWLYVFLNTKINYIGIGLHYCIDIKMIRN